VAHRITAPTVLHVLLFALPADGGRRDLLSFPTRRSSDLDASGKETFPALQGARQALLKIAKADAALAERAGESRGPDEATLRRRSEEHTSELQSRENLVCRLLLEKKKTNSTYPT